jgi:hypothetical protein
MNCSMSSSDRCGKGRVIAPALRLGKSCSAPGFGPVNC